MIRRDKLDGAIYALAGVVMGSRAMVENGATAKALGEVMDFLEYLPPLLATPDDATDAFGAMLAWLAERHPQFDFARARFSDAVPQAWWAG